MYATGAHRGQRVLDPLDLDFQEIIVTVQCGCRELNLNPLEESSKHRILTAELPLQVLEEKGFCFASHK